jgi:hypothetical protein
MDSFQKIIKRLNGIEKAAVGLDYSQLLLVELFVLLIRLLLLNWYGYTGDPTLERGDGG